MDKMLKVTVLFILCLAYQGHCQFFSDFHSNPDEYIRHYLNWRSNTGPGQLWPPRPESRRDVEETTSRDREPLGPEFSDPNAQAEADVGGDIDTGIIDVDASGLPNGFPSGFPDISDNTPGGFPSYGESFPVFFNLFGGLRSTTPWWNGPNVCIDREETTENDEKEGTKKKRNGTEDDGFLATINLSSCHETADKYECVTKTNNRGIMKTFTIKYKCCYGYKRAKHAPGCTKVDLKNMLDTIQDVEAYEFKKMITAAGLEDNFRTKNYTVFVPQDKALSNFGEFMTELNQVEPARRKRDLKNALSSKDLILNHITPGFADLTDIQNEQVLTCELKGSSIRLNIYPTASGEKLITANCAPVRKANVLAENGIVHVIDGVIPPATTTISQLLQSSSKLKMFRKVLKNANLTALLEKRKSFTLLAPTDEAFEKLNKETREKLFDGDACALNILKYHIIPHTVCSSAINGNVTTHNIEGEILNLERKEDDRLIIDGNIEIIKADIMAADGVIHMIDTVFLPDSGLHIMQILKKHNYTRFEKLVRKFPGLSDDLNNMKNSSYFIPTNDAFTDEIDSLLEGEDKLPEEAIVSLVKYHTSPEKLYSCDFTNNQQLETGIEERARINLYSTLPIFSNVVNRATINCARIIESDRKTCSSVVHVVDKVMVPPTQNMLEIINNNDEFSILSKLINGTIIQDMLENEALSVTFLAPTDQALEQISEKDMSVLLTDKKKTSEIFLNHILKEVLCCSGVGATPWNFNNYIQTMSGQSKEISRNSHHQVRVGSATLTKCDIMATNGVIHEVNKAMLPIKRSFPFQNLGLFLFDY